MAYDLEEQEQIDALKAWWKQYGNLSTWLLIAALAVYAGWTFWNSHERNQSLEASQTFESLRKYVSEKNNEKVQTIAADIENRFPQTSYATMAALTAAKSAFDLGDVKVAKTQLQWVIDHAKAIEYKELAKIRLAGIALDTKEYDAALALVSGEFVSEFAGDAADRKGDILLAQNKVGEARIAFQEALSKTKESSPGRQLVQMKLDSIGGAVASAANESTSAK